MKDQFTIKGKDKRWHRWVLLFTKADHLCCLTTIPSKTTSAKYIFLIYSWQWNYFDSCVGCSNLHIKKLTMIINYGYQVIKFYQKKYHYDLFWRVGLTVCFKSLGFHGTHFAELKNIEGWVDHIYCIESWKNIQKTKSIQKSFLLLQQKRLEEVKNVERFHVF